MIQRRTWEDIPAKTSEGKELPNKEGVVMPDETNPPTIGTMAFRGMNYQFSGLDRAQVGEAAARWIIRNTGKDEVEQLALVTEVHDATGDHYTTYILTKVGTSIVVSQSNIKPKVYR